MKTIGVRIGLSALTLLGMAFAASDLQAAGPATTQQAVIQVQSTVAEASAGWRRCCGYGYYGRRGWGYGFGGYGYGYGYPAYGYAGYGYVRPRIYSYPSYYGGYYNSPRYYSGYSYGMPCCGYSYSAYQPVTYSLSSYSSPSQPIVYGSSVYSTPTVYGTPAYSYGSSVYSPTVITTPSYNISTPSTVYPSYPSSTIAPTPIGSPTPAVSAPYPAPPVEYSQPSVYRSPVASTTIQMVATTPTYSPSPTYSPTVSLTLPQHATYAPVSYHYSPATNLNGSLAYNIVW